MSYLVTAWSNTLMGPNLTLHLKTLAGLIRLLEALDAQKKVNIINIRLIDDPPSDNFQLGLPT